MYIYPEQHAAPHSSDELRININNNNAQHRSPPRLGRLPYRQAQTRRLATARQGAVALGVRAVAPMERAPPSQVEADERADQTPVRDRCEERGQDRQAGAGEGGARFDDCPDGGVGGAGWLGN